MPGWWFHTKRIIIYCDLFLSLLLVFWHSLNLFIFLIPLSKCSFILLWLSCEHFKSSWTLPASPPHFLTPSPCSVLVASRHSGLEAALPEDRVQLWTKGNRMVKMAVWGLSATLGAAVFAVAQTAMEWGPEVLLQLFWPSGGDLNCLTHTQTHSDTRHKSVLMMNPQFTNIHTHRQTLKTWSSSLLLRRREKRRGGLLSWCQTDCCCSTTMSIC